jgi:hypothetical protein
VFGRVRRVGAGRCVAGREDYNHAHHAAASPPCSVAAVAEAAAAAGSLLLAVCERGRLAKDLRPSSRRLRADSRLRVAWPAARNDIRGPGPLAAAALAAAPAAGAGAGGPGAGGVGDWGLLGLSSST